MKKQANNTTAQVLEKIAKEFLNRETLETRNIGDLDFRENAVWCIKAALEAAYKAGKDSK